MIDIENIKAGWLNLKISNNYFTVSYLTNFATVMEHFLTFKKKTLNMEVHRAYFDGEGKDLYLTGWITDKTLFIIWECYDEKDAAITKLMKFNADKFINEYFSKFKEIKAIYYRDFASDNFQ